MKRILKYKDWLEEWLIIKKAFVKESTHANYSTLIYNQIIPLLGDILLHKISESIIQKSAIYWLNSGRKDQKGGLKEKTVRDIITIIKISIKYATKIKLITHKIIEINLPKSKEIKKLKILSKDDQLSLVQSIYLNLKSRNAGILLCLYTGIRIGELCALQWKDIDLENRTLTISKTVQRIYLKKSNSYSKTKLIITSPKTVSSNRMIPLSTTIYPILKKINPNNPEMYLLTNDVKLLEPRTYRDYYDRYIKKINIQHINFHCLRHTFATRLIENGADYKTVSILLGHASINMTLNLYVHPQLEQKRKVVELINDFL